MVWTANSYFTLVSIKTLWGQFEPTLIDALQNYPVSEEGESIYLYVNESAIKQT